MTVRSFKWFAAYTSISLLIMMVAPAAIAAQSPLICSISPLPDDIIVTSASGRYIMVQKLYNDFNTAYTGGNIRSITVWDRTTCQHATYDINGAEFWGWSPNEHYLAFGKRHRGPSMGSYCSFTFIFNGDLTTSLFDSPACQSPGEGGVYPVRWEDDNRLTIYASGNGMPAALSKAGLYKYDPSTQKAEFISPPLPPQNTSSDTILTTSSDRLHHITIVNTDSGNQITTWSDSNPTYKNQFDTSGKSAQFFAWSNDSHFAVIIFKVNEQSEIKVFDAILGQWVSLPQVCNNKSVSTCAIGNPLSISPISDTLLTSSGWLINLNSLRYAQIPVANDLEKVSWSPDEKYLLTEWLPSKANTYCGKFAIWAVENIELRYFHVSSSCGEHIAPDYVIAEWHGILS